MTSDRWNLVTRIFEAALDKPENLRSEFVLEACEGDLQLEAEVRSLLAADEKAGSFLERPALETLPAQSTLDQSHPLLSPGKVVSGRFEVRRLIGQGGMGQVYEAFDTELNSRIALKAIRPDISSNPRVLSRFRREVQLTRRITHPNVCRTFDIDRHTETSNGVEDQVTFLTMELLEGETLADLLRRQGRLATSEALPLVLQMIEALSAAHSVGIVHRDFKPSNVLLVHSNASSSTSSTNGVRVVVTDFGLARAVLPDPDVPAGPSANSLTGSGGMMGTLIYMAPEQFERGEASVASDIYSLGLVLYEMVTGQRPFADPMPFAEAAKRIKQPAPSPRLLVPDLDPAWEAVICKCLAAEPEKRFENVRQMAEALGHEPGSSTFRSQRLSAPITTAQSGVLAAPKPATWRTWGVGVAALLLAVSLSAVVYRHYIRQAPLQFAERDWILVTDIANKTGEKAFDRVIRDLVVQSVSQSRYVNVVPRLMVLEAAKRTGAKEGTAIDEILGTEICLRENYKALIVGEIVKDGPIYSVALRLRAPTTDSAAVSISERIRSDEDLFAAIDRIAGRIRESLGESLSRVQSSNKPLAQVTTRSLDALQRYSTAVDLYAAAEYERSVLLAKDAVDRDPGFAMAHLLLAHAYEQIGDEKQFNDELQLATSLVDRVSEKERHLILAASYSSKMLNEKAADEYQHLLDIFPDDVDALRGYAWEGFWAGRVEQAIAAQRKVLARNPEDPGAYDALMALLVRGSHFEEALSVHDVAKRKQLESPNLTYMDGVANWGEGNNDRAMEEFNSLAGQANNYWKIMSRLSVGKLFAFQGRLQEALSSFRAGLALARMARFDNWASAFEFQIARAEILIGDKAAAKTGARNFAKAAEQAPIALSLQRAAAFYLQVGDLPSATHFARLAGVSVKARPDPFSEMQVHDLYAQVKLASRDWNGAIDEERSALAFRAWYSPHLTLGLACELSGKLDCAINAYKQYLNFEGLILTNDAPEDWVVAHFYLARAYSKAGDAASATQEYRQFQRLFAAADKNLAIIDIARKEAEQWHLSTTVN
jgi:tetratricopeptide (TPR) repeat protein